MGGWVPVETHWRSKDSAPVITAMQQLVGGEEQKPANRQSPFHQDQYRPSRSGLAMVWMKRREYAHYISKSHSLLE